MTTRALLTIIGLIKGVFVSGDEYGRAKGRKAGFETVLQHPVEVGVLGGDEILVMDFDRVLFDDKKHLLKVANAVAGSGVKVYLLTYHPEHPLLSGISIHHTIEVVKNLDEVLAMIGLVPVGT
jgi:hypothetical protein